MAGKTTGVVLGALIAGAAAGAAPADHWSVGDLTKAMDGLKAKAAATGSASDTLATYNRHHTMLAFRTKDGGAEVHTQYADVFYIVRGTLQSTANRDAATIAGGHCGHDLG